MRTFSRVLRTALSDTATSRARAQVAFPGLAAVLIAGSGVVACGDSTTEPPTPTVASPVSSWTVDVAPVLPFTDVWGTSPSDVYAVGDGGTILHYDGNSWSTMTSGTTVVLNGVWGTSSGDVHVVGVYGTILRGQR